jgi:DNA-binding MarR family transcriptional regulator
MNGMADAPIGRLLGTAGRMCAARFHRVLEAEGLSHAGWQVLLALGLSDGLTQREVAERCYVTSATVTGVVDTLERDGLVTRERGTDDRRVVRVSLTGAGRERLDAARRTAVETMTPVFEGLSARDEQVVRRFLVRTINRLAEENTQ